MDVDLGRDEAIYERLAPGLVRFATGLVGWSNAPDVVAEAFISLFRTQIWSETTNHRALLYRRVYLDAQSWLRSDGRRRARERRAAISERHLAEFPTDDPDVARAVSELSPQQRAVVFLSYWDDLAPAEIAALIEVSEGTVRKQLARARAHLRRTLA